MDLLETSNLFPAEEFDYCESCIGPDRGCPYGFLKTPTTEVPAH